MVSCGMVGPGVEVRVRSRSRCGLVWFGLQRACVLVAKCSAGIAGAAVQQCIAGATAAGGDAVLGACCGTVPLDTVKKCSCLSPEPLAPEPNPRIPRP